MPILRRNLVASDRFPDCRPVPTGGNQSRAVPQYGITMPKSCNSCKFCTFRASGSRFPLVPTGSHGLGTALESSGSLVPTPIGGNRGTAQSIRFVCAQILKPGNCPNQHPANPKIGADLNSLNKAFPCG